MHISSKIYTFGLLICLLLAPLATSLDIPNLIYSSQPGKISITYQGSQPFTVGPLTLSFNLDQAAGIPSSWGTPYLSWTLVSKSAQVYQFTNGVSLDNGALSPGQVISFEYSPNPWSSVAAATQVKLTTVTFVPVEAQIQASVDESLSYQKTITIVNTSPNTLDMAGAILQFNYVGSSFSSAWGTPYVAWTIQKVTGSNLVQLTASSASYMPKIASQQKLTIVFSGAGVVNNIKLFTLQAQIGDPPVNNNNSTENNNTSTNNNTNTNNTTNNNNNTTSNNNNTNSNNSTNNSTSNNTNSNNSTSNNTTTNNNSTTNNTNTNNNSTTNTTSNISGKKYVGYFQTWSEIWASQGKTMTLANLPSYVNVVNLAFVFPDCSYTAGSFDLSRTGLQFSSDSSVVKDAIATLKTRNPNTKVLIAVGGATYTNWAQLNPTAIANLVKDFGLDGVDIDYEPYQTGCSVVSGKISCLSDSEFQDITRKLRAALPRPYLISIAAFSVGAFGEGAFANSQPASSYTGMSINLLRSQYGASIDFINVMSYDASPVFSPTEAYNAYKSYFSGPVMIGVEVPPEAWGGHVLSMTELSSFTSFVNQNNGGGMMIWSLQKKPNGAASNSNPSANMISQAICVSLNLGNCDQSLGL